MAGHCAVAPPCSPACPAADLSTAQAACSVAVAAPASPACISLRLHAGLPLFPPCSHQHGLQGGLPCHGPALCRSPQHRQCDCAGPTKRPRCRWVHGAQPVQPQLTQRGGPAAAGSVPSQHLQLCIVLCLAACLMSTLESPAAVLSRHTINLSAHVPCTRPISSTEYAVGLPLAFFVPPLSNAPGRLSVRLDFEEKRCALASPPTPIACVPEAQCSASACLQSACHDSRRRCCHRHRGCMQAPCLLPPAQALIPQSTGCSLIMPSSHNPPTPPASFSHPHPRTHNSPSACSMEESDGTCSLRLREPCEWDGKLYAAVVPVDTLPVLSGTTLGQGAAVDVLRLLSRQCPPALLRAPPLLAPCLPASPPCAPILFQHPTPASTPTAVRLLTLTPPVSPPPAHCSDDGGRYHQRIHPGADLPGGGTQAGRAGGSSL